MLIFLDDFNIYGRKEEHLNHLKNVWLNVEIMALVSIQKNVHFVSILKYYWDTLFVKMDC